MRSGARANVLMNVTSARIDIKAAAARAERWLERYAGAALGAARRRVARRVPCARVASSDRELGARLDLRLLRRRGFRAGPRALRRGRGARPGSCGRSAGAGPCGDARGAVVVANPSPFARDDVVVLDLPVPTEWDDVSLEGADGSRFTAQEVSRNVAHLHHAEMLGRDIPELVKRRLHGRELFGQWLNGFAVEPGPRLVFELDTVQDPPSIDLVELRTAVLVAAKAKEDERWEVVFRTRPRRRLASRVAAPALGWTGVRAVEGMEAGDSVALEGGVLENGLLRVEVGNDGTLRVGDVEGVGRIVRGFDVGDSYNYAPPADDVLVEHPESVSVESLEPGPVRASLVVRRTYAWPPDHVVEVETHVELRAGEPFVRISVAFDNPADDQRVRVHVPLRQHASHSHAEGQYAVVERGLVAEGGHGEMPLPTFPASSFVSAGGVALLLEHVSEYELLEGRELALDRAAVDRLDQPQHEPVPGGAGRPGAGDPRRADARPPLVLVRDLPARGHAARPGRARAGRALPAPVPHRRGRGRGGRARAGRGAHARRGGRRPDGASSARGPRSRTRRPSRERCGSGGETLELRPWEVRTTTTP